MTDDIDYEDVGETLGTMDITISDGTSSHTETISFTVVNVNENITISIAQKSLTVDEVSQVFSHYQH